MLDEADIRGALRELGIRPASHVLVHASYRSLGGVVGGPAAVVRALVESAATVVMPAFTADLPGGPWVWDARGDVLGNAYPPPRPGAPPPTPVSPDLPIDRAIGVIAETFRRMYPVLRTGDPLSSFVVYGALAAYVSGDPDSASVITPIQRLMEAGGDVLLIGVTHTASTAVHLAEFLAGRALFVRHGLTHDGVRAVQFGGCSEGFDALQPYVEHIECRVCCGAATLRRYPLAQYVEAARRLIDANPNALLCDDPACGRCAARRTAVSHTGGPR